jgi:hypothetical protein
VDLFELAEIAPVIPFRAKSFNPFALRSQAQVAIDDGKSALFSKRGEMRWIPVKDSAPRAFAARTCSILP